MDSSIEEQIRAIEKEILDTQKNKATEHHLGRLKAKLARLRKEVEKRKSHQSAAGRRGFAVKKSGDATVGIIGFPSTGKSTLLNQLTDASSKTGDYDFTTVRIIPGMMRYNGASIQLLDLPGLISGASEGRGRGREIISAVRNVDLLLLLVDATQPAQLDLIDKELYNAGLRLNQKIPDVIVTCKGEGGISVNATVRLSYLNEKIIRAIASEFVINADIIIREDITEDQLIDVFSGNRVYVPAIVVVNKIDLVSSNELKNMLEEIQRERRWGDVIGISAKNGDGLDRLKKKMFSQLRLIRIYMKPVGKKPDYDEPLILRKGDTVGDACRYLHRDFEKKFRYAQVWGCSVKYPGQKVGLDHRLSDGDVLTIFVRH